MRLRATVAALAMLACPAHAQPKAADLDAFVEIYSFDVLAALAEEQLAFRVESGQMSQELANCANRTLRLEDLLPPARPIVAGMFRSERTLKEATAFFLSPTGAKLKEFAATNLRNFTRAQLRGQKPPARPKLPATFTQQDVQIMADFNKSPAGEDFVRFVRDGLPHLRRVGLLDQAIAECRKRK